jgi:hypothetical protein
MIPSDHFVRFYNEVFKFLDKQPGNALEKYWLEISRHQELHCLELFKTRGLQGMYEYWEHIRIEENCDMELQLFDDRLEITMKKCPSLSKVLDNDAAPCEKYCDHCPGWIKPLLKKAGFNCDYNIIDRKLPQCHICIYPEDAGASAKQNI